MNVDEADAFTHELMLFEIVQSFGISHRGDMRQIAPQAYEDHAVLQIPTCQLADNKWMHPHRAPFK